MVCFGLSNNSVWFLRELSEISSELFDKHRKVGYTYTMNTHRETITMSTEAFRAILRIITNAERVVKFSDSKILMEHNIKELKTATVAYQELRQRERDDLTRRCKEAKERTDKLLGR